jgi:hypothetical protein
VLDAVLPLQLPGVAARGRIAVRVAQEGHAVAQGRLVVVAAEMAARHRVVEDEARAADQVRAGVVDRAVVEEEVRPPLGSMARGW